MIFMKIFAFPAVKPLNWLRDNGNHKHARQNSMDRAETTFAPQCKGSYSRMTLMDIDGTVYFASRSTKDNPEP